MSSVMPHAYTPDAIRGMLSGRGTPRFSFDVIYGEHRLLNLERLPLFTASCAFVKSVGELDAEKRHIQFDEPGWESGRCRTA
jgi:hypothetical protein